MYVFRTSISIFALCVCSSCGDTLGEQALFGAGAGGAAAVATDGDLITGAAIGAAGNIAYCRKYPSRC
ncbi:hypothetical protein [Thalassococcus lentus]|uniref:YMGG-like Gly-zipper domain-containing protein n=1 Tax=Thalassococcus lentus TaxID=1210524 RepID=A0ABT4XV91_9RHOB|nr:hypothetical protein [Thalassococcus lentus]MDA7425886.1 hypothetical protein [Thalassococcus lentus]